MEASVKTLVSPTSLPMSDARNFNKTKNSFYNLPYKQSSRQKSQIEFSREPHEKKKYYSNALAFILNKNDPNSPDVTLNFVL